ncbi:4-hydroxy-3-methylbut-2-en-1-yl diphosphate synthase [Candidatus Peregrinibacteria bacterium CG_4_9_14_0_2_um_filter_53_11]|nr:MAG: 4-hydroxy-3-methylbut-2-en-1-yl diphosphate synthase [Candidatus Peregrinibacteria bacterium CG_4_9_14_0_2_um_filter_53_11]
MNQRKTEQVMIGSVPVGGGAPIAIQSMTNTDTADTKATASQIKELVAAGAEIVRVTVNNEEAAAAVSPLVDSLRAEGCTAPIIGDFHFNGHILLEAFPACARALDKYRINPGNVGRGALHDENFATMIRCALRYDKPVRIGVNAGSLDPDLLTRHMVENARLKVPRSDSEVVCGALVASALDSAAAAEELGLPRNKIILSVKVSELPVVVAANKALAGSPYPLHLGLTEAGMGDQGVVASSAALAVLLSQGIGDTIRISLTPRPGEPRAREVELCRWLLQSMGLRSFRPSITSCPGCGRTTNERYQRLAESVTTYIDERLPLWEVAGKKVDTLKIAVMGCVVNGPGEARNADLGISLPGKSEEPLAVIFKRGAVYKTVRGESLEEAFLLILEEFVQDEC